ncbi:MAG: histidine kinase [Cyanobacteria bacterium P01_F01_bin.86]
MAAQVNPASSVVPSYVPRFLRYTEWALFILADFSMVHAALSGIQPRADSNYYLGLVFFVLMIVLSCFFPIRRPLWQRRSYILATLICLTATIWLTGWEIGVFHLIFLMKSCFLLPRRDVIFIAGLIFTIILLKATLSQVFIVESIQESRENFENFLLERPRFMVVRRVTNSLINYVPYSALLALTCLMLTSERQSRQKAAAATEQVTTLATELERTRIAQEIHDGLRQTLTQLETEIELAQHLHETGSEHVLDAVNRTEKLSGQSLQKARKTIATMRQETFDLSKALSDLIEEINQFQSLHVEAKIDLPQLPPQIGRQLYSIVKELLTNTQKHSRSSTVNFWATTTLEQIIVGIEDDGTGFTHHAVSSAPSLKQIQGRVHLLKGQMRIHSTLGEGTLVQLTIPR